LRPPPLTPSFPYTTLFRSPTRLRRTSAKIAETLDLEGIGSRSTVRCADCVSERPLTFASPHHTIYWIAANIIFSKSLPKCLHFGDRKSTRLNSSHQIISYA